MCLTFIFVYYSFFFFLLDLGLLGKIDGWVGGYLLEY